MINQIYSYLLERLEPRENYPCFDLLSYYTYVVVFYIYVQFTTTNTCVAYFISY